MKGAAVVAQIDANHAQASFGGPAARQGLPVIEGAKQAVQDDQGPALALVEVMK